MILSKAERVLREIEGGARGRRFLPIVGPASTE